MTAAPARAPSITERVDKVRALDPSSRSVTPPVPRSAKIELTSSCDMHCYFCASHKHPRPSGEMSQALYTRIVDELRMVGVEQLGLFYIGESMLCDWLPEAIRYAKHVCRFPYVFLTTNGLSATPERLRACMAAKLDSIKFAFNWSGASEFERVTGLPGTEYDLVLANLKAARSVRDDVQHETGHRCALYASTVRYDEGQPERMRATLQQIESCVDQHYWLPLLGHCGLPSPKAQGRPVPVKDLPCWALFSEAHITSDGKLSACSLDASSRFHMGDLEKTSFVAAWHSPAFRELRARHLEHNVKGTACQSCVAY
jgi:radical SAM protein with 4Fe4S-binding SPASM domain